MCITVGAARRRLLTSVHVIAQYRGLYVPLEQPENRFQRNLYRDGNHTRRQSGQGSAVRMVKTTLQSTMARSLGICCAAILALFPWAEGLQAQPDTQIIQQTTSSKSFEDVIFDLEFAITQRNFRISARNDIGRAIRERGEKDFPQAMIIHFCNITIAREALELDPLLITHMPCRVAVYDHGDRITVSTTSLRDDSDDQRLNEFARRINAILREILRFAVEQSEAWN